MLRRALLAASLLALAAVAPAVQAAASVRVDPDGDGRYRAAGRIGSVGFRFLLDTSAPLVLLSAADARRAGIDYRRGMRIQVAVGGRPLPAYRVVLPRVALGAIELAEVPAAVVEGATSPTLGLSFLGRLQIRQQGRSMVLEQVR